MIASKVALASGLVLVGVLCVLAAIGFTAMVAPLVTVFVLLVLIATGSLLSARRSQ